VACQRDFFLLHFWWRTLSLSGCMVWLNLKVWYSIFKIVYCIPNQNQIILLNFNYSTRKLFFQSMPSQLKTKTHFCKKYGNLLNCGKVHWALLGFPTIGSYGACSFSNFDGFFHKLPLYLYLLQGAMNLFWIFIFNLFIIVLWAKDSAAGPFFPLTLKIELENNKK